MHHIEILITEQDPSVIFILQTIAAHDVQRDLKFLQRPIKSIPLGDALSCSTPFATSPPPPPPPPPPPGCRSGKSTTSHKFGIPIPALEKIPQIPTSKIYARACFKVRTTATSTKSE